jgi:hypothetical protein
MTDGVRGSTLVHFLQYPPVTPTSRAHPRSRYDRGRDAVMNLSSRAASGSRIVFPKWRQYSQRSSGPKISRHRSNLGELFSKIRTAYMVLAYFISEIFSPRISSKFLFWADRTAIDMRFVCGAGLALVQPARMALIARAITGRSRNMSEVVSTALRNRIFERRCAMEFSPKKRGPPGAWLRGG